MLYMSFTWIFDHHLEEQVAGLVAVDVEVALHLLQPQAHDQTLVRRVDRFLSESKRMIMI